MVALGATVVKVMARPRTKLGRFSLQEMKRDRKQNFCCSEAAIHYAYLNGRCQENSLSALCP
jgi:hypothetical protein